MELKNKTVSVVMCTYNGEKYLREQLDSIIAQTYPVLELIIQDDGSTDGTKSILNDYAARYPYVDVYYNDVSKGINGNFISCIRRAKGDYIAIADQDDIWEPDKLSVQIEQIGSRMFSSGFSKPFISGKNVKVHFDNRKPNCTVERFIHVGSLPGHTQLLRKDFFSKIPEIDYWLQYFMYDHLFQIVAACYNSIAFCDKVLVNQRRHLSASTYTEPINYKKNIKNIFITLKRTWLLYKELRPVMRNYFEQVYSLLSSLPEDAKYKKDAQKIAYYQSQTSIEAYVKLTCLYVKCRYKIFYTNETPKCVSLVRSLFFPITCSDYFRYLSKSKLNP